MSFFIRILNITLFVAELLLATLPFFRKLELRKLWWLSLIGGLGLTMGFAALFSMFKEYVMSLINTSEFSSLFFGLTYIASIVQEILFFIVYAVCVFVIFKTTLFNVSFVCCVAFSIQSIASSLFALFLRLCGNDKIYALPSFANPVNTVAYLLIYAAVYLGSYFLFIKNYVSGDEVYLDKRIMLILIGVIVINMIVGAVSAPRENNEAGTVYLFMLIARVLMCIIGLTLQFILLRWLKSRFELTELQSIMSRQREQYEIAKESINTVNINAHDLKHQINVILQAVKNDGSSAAIASELKEILKSANIIDTVYHTGNNALDVTLTEKARVCVSSGIRLSLIADGSGLGFMNDVDIYTLFGNALDNATEAVSLMEDNESKIISFSIRKSRGAIVIHSENTCAEMPNFVNGLPQTSKEDKQFHGYGVKSMKHIVDKYNGNMLMRANNGMFYLDIVIPDQSV